ncbi:MAG: methyltransferase domain-containing protein [Terracidiphilus sp.]|nr:methyltransferase domain-containing protein [Terracidiphilus sp.]
MTTLALPKSHPDRPIEGLAAKWYASNTADFMNEFTALAQRISAQLTPERSVLEVAPGPGYFCVELGKLGLYKITGLDLSRAMVKIAAQKAAEAGVEAQFTQGSASNMPFPSNTFDFLLCRAAFKNFAHPVVALREMCRVLRPGGRGLIIDLKRNADPTAVSRYVDNMGLKRLNRIMTRMVFKHSLIKNAYTREEFERMIAPAKFSRVEIGEEEIGFEIWLTK